MCQIAHVHKSVSYINPHAHASVDIVKRVSDGKAHCTYTCTHGEHQGGGGPFWYLKEGPLGTCTVLLESSL
jgi:hypothetical protein